MTDKLFLGDLRLNAFTPRRNHTIVRSGIKRIKDGNIAADVARDTLAAVQTPQVFRADILRRAYEAEYRPEFTDDASVVEQAGEAVFLCEGERTNLKITTPEDMVIAEALLAGREKTEESADGENL